VELKEGYDFGHSVSGSHPKQAGSLYALACHARDALEASVVRGGCSCTSSHACHGFVRVFEDGE